MAIDHILSTPAGRVSMNSVSAGVDPKTRRKAAQRSFVATNRKRAALHEVEVIQGDDSSWLHVRGGKVVASFVSLSEAVSAL